MNYVILIIVTVLCGCSFVCAGSVSKDQVFSFSISKQWNGKPTNHAPIHITLQEDSLGNQLIFNIDAPYYNDPKPPGTKGPTEKMWKHEVVELYFANEDNEYLQIQLGPHGHHLVLLFKNERNLLYHMLPLNTETELLSKRWTGTANIPAQYFPPKVTRFNAFAINGPENQRRYWALYPADASSSNPDFHQLKYFKPIELKGPYAHQTEYSAVWKVAYSNSGATSVTTIAGLFCRSIVAVCIILCGRFMH